MDSLTKQQWLLLAGIVAGLSALFAIGCFLFMGAEEAAVVGAGGGAMAAEAVRRASRRRQEREAVIDEVDDEVQDQKDRLDKLPQPLDVIEELAPLTPDEKADIGNNLL